MRLPSASFLVVVCVSFAFGAAAQSIAVTGPEGLSRTVTGRDLAGMPRDSVTLPNEHGSSHRYEGVPLTSLLQSVGAPVGKTLHGPALADYVVVGASDGYRVVLALAETDPSVVNRKVILADRADGSPLPANEGPFRLVVEGDLRPTRSARMVISIQVKAAPGGN